MRSCLLLALLVGLAAGQSSMQDVMQHDEANFDSSGVEMATNKDRDGNVGDDFEFKAQEAVMKMKKKEAAQQKQQADMMKKMIAGEDPGTGDAEQQSEPGGVPGSLLRHDAENSELSKYDKWEAQQEKEEKHERAKLALQKARSEMHTVTQHRFKKVPPQQPKKAGLRAPTYDN
eukprot:g1649.t1